MTRRVQNPAYGRELGRLMTVRGVNVASFVHRARLPFILEKILSVPNGGLPGVICAKGRSGNQLTPVGCLHCPR